MPFEVYEINEIRKMKSNVEFFFIGHILAQFFWLFAFVKSNKPKNIEIDILNKEMQYGKLNATIIQDIIYTPGGITKQNEICQDLADYILLYYLNFAFFIIKLCYSIGKTYFLCKNYDKIYYNHTQILQQITKLIRIEQRFVNMLMIFLAFSSLCVFYFEFEKFDDLNTCSYFLSERDHYMLWVQMPVTTGNIVILVPFYLILMMQGCCQDYDTWRKQTNENRNNQLMESIRQENIIKMENNKKGPNGFKIGTIRDFMDQYVQSLKFKVFTAEDSCGICLLEFQKNDNIKSLNCKDFDMSKIEFYIDSDGTEAIKPSTNDHQEHIFHHECIRDWFFKKLECPLCRVSYVSVIKSMIKTEEFREKYDKIKTEYNQSQKYLMDKLLRFWQFSQIERKNALDEIVKNEENRIQGISRQNIPKINKTEFLTFGEEKQYIDKLIKFIARGRLWVPGINKQINMNLKQIEGVEQSKVIKNSPEADFHKKKVQDSIELLQFQAQKWGYKSEEGPSISETEEIQQKERKRKYRRFRLR